MTAPVDLTNDLLLAAREDALRTRASEIVAGRMLAINNALVAEAVTLEAWQDAMIATVRRAHIEAYALGRGGMENMTQADYGRIGAFLRREYGFLRDFVAEIHAGNLTGDALRVRLEMYAKHTQQTFWTGARSLQANEGMSEERRVVNAGESCEDCTFYESEGWQEIGYFPPPGNDAVCMANCNCGMEFR
jgi:hypothetical protein